MLHLAPPVPRVQDFGDETWMTDSIARNPIRQGPPQYQASHRYQTGSQYQPNPQYQTENFNGL